MISSDGNITKKVMVVHSVPVASFVERSYVVVAVLGDVTVAVVVLYCQPSSRCQCHCLPAG